MVAVKPEDTFATGILNVAVAKSELNVIVPLLVVHGTISPTLSEDEPLFVTTIIQFCLITSADNEPTEPRCLTTPA